MNAQGEVIGVNTLVATAPVLDSEGHPLPLRIAAGTGINLATSVEQVKSFVTGLRQKRVSPVSTLRDISHTIPLAVSVGFKQSC